MHLVVRTFHMRSTLLTNHLYTHNMVDYRYNVQQVSGIYLAYLKLYAY